MPKFLTISPTHVAGKKEFAWTEFLKGNYIAIGWLHDSNLTGKNIDEIVDLIRAQNYENEASGIESFTKFLALDIGDYVGVNNTNSGIFGVGVIKSGYKYEKFKHNTGDDNDEENYYPHFREVEWKYTSYVRREDIVGPDETGWKPYGTVGRLDDEVPPYIRRLLGENLPTTLAKKEIVIPRYLGEVVKSINKLKADEHHQERGHESLVEEFFSALDYQKHTHIQFQKGRVDISLSEGENQLAIVEVKKDWNLSIYNKKGLEYLMQAYRYALDKGARWVILTNGEYYAIFDRLKGLSRDSNLIGEFKLTNLTDEDEKIIQRFAHDNLVKPDTEELFKYLSEAFKKK